MGLQMKCLSLDLGHLSGWCIDKKHHGHFESPGDNIGQEFNNFEDYLKDLVVKYFPFDLVAYERPHMRGWAATFSLIGRAAIVEKIFARYETKVVKYHPSTVKKFITGSGRADKELVRMGVLQQGWKVDSFDESDAIALWLYVQSLNHS